MRARRRTPRGSAAAIVTIALVFAGLRDARAEGKDELDVRADEVSVDTKLLELSLRGNVHADAPPFHLSADALKLKRTPTGIVVEGEGKLTFCPCLGTPLGVAFSRALVAPPGDLILTSPRLLVFGAPVFWLPWFWLRAPTRVGLLPPEIAYRGSDGVYLGAGVHLPWVRGESDSGLDLRAGAYFQGGLAASADLTTPSSFTRLRYDRLVGSTQGGDDGLLADVRGALAETRAVTTELAWGADALRGARGVYATEDVATVAKPYDRLRVEARVRDGGFLWAAGLRADSRRGGELGSLEALGPVATFASSGALGEAGETHATLEGGVLRVPGGTSMSFARGSAGLLLAGRVGALGVSASALAIGDVASDGESRGKDGAAHARVEATLPLGRTYESSEPGDPWRHRLEPLAFLSGLASGGEGALATGARGGLGASVMKGDAATAGAGLRTAVARWAKGEGLSLEGTVGAVIAHPTDASLSAGDAPLLEGATPLARWRAAAQASLLAVSAEGAHVIGDRDGHAYVARVRVGESSGLFARAWIAARQGLDPVAARLLTDPAMETPTGFLSEGGTTGGVRAGIPWAKFLATRGGVDVDLGERTLVAAVATIELRDGCGCFRVRATGAHRLGRDGVDVWLSLDLTPESAKR